MYRRINTPRFLLNKTAFARAAAAGLLLLSAQAAHANCTATMQNINFGNIDLLNPGTLTAQATVEITCSRSFLDSSRLNVCLAVDGGKTVSPAQTNPRYMCPNGTCTSTANRLAFNLYTDTNHSTIWGSPNYATPVTLNTVIEFPWFTFSQSKSLTVYARLNTPLSNVAPGQYANNFSEGSTALAFSATNSSTPQACSDFQAIRFPFTVSANIVKNCNVSTPNDIDFGTVNPADTNLEGRTSFNVTCTRSTPYNIGLKPSNGNTAGAGEMKPTASGNTDKIPYQLRSVGGSNGRIWGNTATATRTGNGVGGTGNGSAQNYDIYATLPSADYHYGDYRDTVTIQVNY